MKKYSHVLWAKRTEQQQPPQQHPYQSITHFVERKRPRFLNHDFKYKYGIISDSHWNESDHLKKDKHKVDRLGQKCYGSNCPLSYSLMVSCLFRSSSSLTSIITFGFHSSLQAPSNMGSILSCNHSADNRAAKTTHTHTHTHTQTPIPKQNNTSFSQKMKK